MSLKRFGVSLDEEVLSSLDQYVRENGFTNRSQAIRFFVEKSIAEEKWQCNHTVAGTIVMMYDVADKEIASRIDELQKTHRELILSSSKYYVTPATCLHVATVMGLACRLTELSEQMLAIKGLKHGKLLMSRAD